MFALIRSTLRMKTDARVVETLTIISSRNMQQADAYRTRASTCDDNRTGHLAEFGRTDLMRQEQSHEDYIWPLWLKCGEEPRRADELMGSAHTKR